MFIGVIGPDNGSFLRGEWALKFRVLELLRVCSPAFRRKAELLPSWEIPLKSGTTNT
jgi:hypothetical protein